MSIRRFVVVGLFAASLSGAANGMSEGSIQKGTHFRVVCHFHNDEIARAALAAAEATWPVATKLMAVTEPTLEKRLDVHLFRTAADYEAAEAELTNGRFRRNLAFAHWDTKAAYVAIQPACTDVALQQVGLPALTRRLIAHESTHLVRFSAMPNFRSHPDWLADGLAMCAANQVMVDNHWAAGPMSDPNMSTTCVDVAELLDRGALPSVDQIMDDQLDKVAWGDRYAVRWAWFNFLKDTTDDVAYRTIMNKARTLGGGAGYGQQLRAHVTSVLGPKRASAIDSEFARHVRQYHPEWKEVYRSLETAGAEWTQIAFPDTNAIAWRTESVGGGNYVLSGRFKVLPGERQQLNLLLGRSVEGFVSVAFTAGGGVTIFKYTGKGNAWDRIGYVDVETFLPGSWMPFSVSVVDDTISVALAGKTVMHRSLGGRSMSGPWGLGAQSGSVGIWKEVVLDRLAPRGES